MLLAKHRPLLRQRWLRQKPESEQIFVHRLASRCGLKPVFSVMSPCFGGFRPKHQWQRADAFVRREAGVRIVQNGRPPVQANIVVATLEQGVAEGHVQNRRQRGQVLMEKLLLEVLGVGRHDESYAVLHRIQNCRREVGDRLAHARAGFHGQMPPVVDGLGYGLRHFDLLGTVFVPGDPFLEASAGFEHVADRLDVERMVGWLALNPGCLPARVEQRGVRQSPARLGSKEFSSHAFVGRLDQDRKQARLRALHQSKHLLLEFQRNGSEQFNQIEVDSRQGFRVGKSLIGCVALNGESSGEGLNAVIVEGGHHGAGEFAHAVYRNLSGETIQGVQKTGLKASVVGNEGQFGGETPESLDTGVDPLRIPDRGCRDPGEPRRFFRDGAHGSDIRLETVDDLTVIHPHRADFQDFGSGWFEPGGFEVNGDERFEYRHEFGNRRSADVSISSCRVGYRLFRKKRVPEVESPLTMRCGNPIMDRRKRGDIEFTRWNPYPHGGPGVFKEKQTFEIQLETHQMAFLEEVAARYRLEDASKAVRCLVNFSIDEPDEQDRIFDEVRCLDCG